jgi:hypothetical protein
MLGRAVIATMFAGFLAPSMLCPDQYVTRGELAVFLKRILDHLYLDG